MCFVTLFFSINRVFHKIVCRIKLILAYNVNNNLSFTFFVFQYVLYNFNFNMHDMFSRYIVRFDFLLFFFVVIVVKIISLHFFRYSDLCSSFRNKTFNLLLYVVFVLFLVALFFEILWVFYRLLYCFSDIFQQNQLLSFFVSHIDFRCFNRIFRSQFVLFYCLQINTTLILL